MRDVDTMMLQADPTVTTSLAVALEAAMLLDDAAQARYLAIYGVEWQPLSDVFASQESVSLASDYFTGNAANSNARTCVA